MQENAAAGALLKWPVGVREGFSARQEPRVREGRLCCVFWEGEAPAEPGSVRRHDPVVRREPHVHAGDILGTTEHQLGDNAEAALCLVVISARNG